MEGEKKRNNALLGIVLMALSEQIPGVQVLPAHKQKPEMDMKVGISSRSA